jgi:nucleotide-binding universal stress UspA family protein
MDSRNKTERPRLVVGVDGFEPSMAALRWAIHQARLTGAVVEAVTAWHVPVGTGYLQAADMPDYQEDAFDVLAEAIAQMYVIDPDVEVCPRVVEGQAGQVLVHAAEGADLLVVGCRGHGGLADMVLGSVSQFCAHHAPCPVVIMRGKPSLCQPAGTGSRALVGRCGQPAGAAEAYWRTSIQAAVPAGVPGSWRTVAWAAARARREAR